MLPRSSRELFWKTRCVDGRLMRHDEQPDDPYLETDVGACPGCNECEPDDANGEDSGEES